MESLHQQRIIVGISAGVAAYKSAILVRRLVEQGARVRVMMTSGARQFITPLTLQALSGHPVHTELLDADAESGMDHIELARWADQIVIAPATADLIARLGAGMADDIVTTVCLATAAPVWLAPAMNQQMWQHPATRRNVTSAQSLGYRLLGPDAGDQACGETGPGRMLEPEQIVSAICSPDSTEVIAPKYRVVITAGPTFEPLDPVRGITNRSSGKMGYALARAAASRGAAVTLISGPTALSCPAGVALVDVERAEDMLDAALSHCAEAEVFIAVAAVADYRPVAVSARKIKKSGERITLELERNPDILATVSARFDNLVKVGFAAETEDLLANANGKLKAKKLDMICANNVSRGAVFGSDSNELTLITRTGTRHLGPGPKDVLAAEVVAQIEVLLNAGNQPKDP